MRTEFPYRVTGPEDLPANFSAAPPAEVAIFVPPQGFGSWRNRQAEPARLLAAGEGRVWVVEEAGEEAIRREIPFEDLVEVELGNVLLHAWVGFAPGGAEPVHIDFNLVALPIFENFIGRILLNLRGDARGGDPETPVELSGLDLKFRNAVRGRLLPGEEIDALAFAPALWGRRFLILRRRLVAATALVLTDWRLLVVEEGEPVRENTYGSTAYTIPRDRIVGVTPIPEGIDVVCRSRAGGHQRPVPLSDPEVAKPVIRAMTRRLKP
jgi:hypothetical protein